MRLAVVTSTISRNAGGLFYSVRSLHQAVATDGWSIQILALRDEFTEADRSQWAPLPVGVHPPVGFRGLGYSPALQQDLDDYAPDLVHVHGLWQGPSIASVRHRAKTGCPNVISPRGMLDPWAYRNSRWKKRLAGILFEFRHLRTASCLNALCVSEARSIRQFGLRNPVAVIPNGVEFPDIRSEGPKVEGQRSGERKTLLFLGRIHPKKGLGQALRAWHEAWSMRHEGGGLRREGDWQFVIAGWDQGGHRAELEQLCREFGVSVADVSVDEFLESSCLMTHASRGGSAAPCLFVGPAFGEQKDALLRRADAFILPSFSEGLPMAVLEAWAYGLPVLMTDACNLPEGFAVEAAIRIGNGAGGGCAAHEAGGGGAAHEARGMGHGAGGMRRGAGGMRRGAGGMRMMTIEEGLLTLFEMSDEDRAEMGRRGRELVEERFTWPRVAAQMKEVYEWVLGGGEKPGCVE